VISPVGTPAGTRYRVRIGPFAAREQAKAMQDRMKQYGFNGALAQD